MEVLRGDMIIIQGIRRGGLYEHLLATLQRFLENYCKRLYSDC
jgi:hypothetical protein